MKLYELTTITDDTGANVVRVSGRLADNPDPAKQTEYITFQFAIDAQANLGGGTLRQYVLQLMCEQLEVERVRAGNLRGQSSILPKDLR